MLEDEALVTPVGAVPQGAKKATIFSCLQRLVQNILDKEVKENFQKEPKKVGGWETVCIQKGKVHCL